MKEVNEIQLNKYFNLKEFECPCCHRVMLHPTLLQLLYNLRLAIDRPVYLNSGYRCNIYNTKVGGTTHSYHTYGMAADVFVKDMKQSDLALHAQKIGFMGIGIYRTFCHLDVRPDQFTWYG